MPNSHPWIVSLREYKNSVLYDHFCAGVLISERRILTASHCVNKLLTSKIVAVVGLHIRTDISDYALNNTYHVARIIIHENYNRNNTENDIAMLILRDSVRFSANVAPICLPNSAYADEFIGKQVVVAGWGLESNNQPSTELKQTSMVLMDNEDMRCRANLNEFNRKMMYCAMGLGIERTSICIGDSGGPLIYKDIDRWYLLGIVSYVPGYLSSQTNKYFCDSSSPSYFTRIPLYVSWIYNF
jgi:secreted trypsin-like serine protease